MLSSHTEESVTESGVAHSCKHTYSIANAPRSRADLVEDERIIGLSKLFAAYD